MTVFGVVAFYNVKKGWGIIKSDAREVFVHFTQILEKNYSILHKGDKVEFELYEDPKDRSRFIAVNVKKVS